MRSWATHFSTVVIALGASACNASQPEKAPPAETQTPQANAMQGSADWRTRMQTRHNADSSVEQQVRRLTQDLSLSSQQQTKVRQLSQWHERTIQAILDTAPPTLTYEAFQTRVHDISRQYHDSVNAILTPQQLQLMRNMVGRVDSGTERRRPPPR